MALEPSAGMAAVARRALAGPTTVQIEISDFEAWDAAGRVFPLLYSAQAWHWLRPDVRYVRAREVLGAGGLLAAYWNRPDWTPSELREPLLEVHERVAPELERDGPKHPATVASDARESWEEEIAAAAGLGASETRHYDWSRRYTAAQYAGLLATISELRLLSEALRERLLAEVEAPIESRGGFTLPLRTRLCLARRCR